MITDSFDLQSEPLVKLEDFYGSRKNIVDTCIVTFSYEIYQHVLKQFNCLEIAKLKAANGTYPIYKFDYKGKSFGFYLSMIGSTMAAQFVIEVNHVIGANKFIIFGSSGSLNPSTKGKYVIPTSSYRDEGMSYHYAAPSEYIEIKNHRVVKKVFEELSLPFIEGRIWTTDAFLRETKNQIAKRQNEGCIAVEMELAGVQAVCDFHHLELYAFLVTGDIVSTTYYDKGELHQANHNLDKFYVALDLALRISI